MANSADVRKNATTFDLTRFFHGETHGWGIFEDRFGNVRRRFHVAMSGRWDGDVFILDERFEYDTGEAETRTWRVSPQIGDRFSATSADCIGSLQGIATDDSVRMCYRFNLKLEGRTIAVDFVDRIYRLSDGLAMNRATMSKWGIKLGELSLFFERVDAKSRVPVAAAAA